MAPKISLLKFSAKNKTGKSCVAVGETEAEVMELIHEAIEFLSKASAMKAKTYHSRDRMSAMSKSSQHKLVQMIVKAYEVHSNNDPEQN